MATIPFAKGEKLRLVRTLFHYLTTSTENFWRKKLDKEFNHLLYITPEVLIKGNPELNELPPDIKSLIINKYIELFNKKVPYISDIRKRKVGESTFLADPIRLTNRSDAVIIAGLASKNKRSDAFAKLQKKLAEVTKEIDNEIDHFRGTKGNTHSAIDLGHTMVGEGVPYTTPAGKKITTSINVLSDAKTKLSTTKQKVSLDENIVPGLKTLLDDLSTIHTDYSFKFDRSLINDVVTANFKYIVVVPQLHKINQDILGNKEAALSRQIKKLLSDYILTVRGSKSIKDLVHGHIKNAILGKKSKGERHYSKGKSSGFVKTKTGVKKINTSSIVSARLKKVKKLKQYEGFESLFELQNLINERLHDAIQERMGESSDPPVVLRYQTGRFAESAKLLTLTRSQAQKLYGTYTYMRYPYDVFLPGHRLGTRQRDPRQFIEGGIRGIAAKVLREKYPGILLELK